MPQLKHLKVVTHIVLTSPVFFFDCEVAGGFVGCGSALATGPSADDDEDEDNADDEEAIDKDEEEADEEGTDEDDVDDEDDEDEARRRWHCARVWACVRMWVCVFGRYNVPYLCRACVSILTHPHSHLHPHLFSVPGAPRRLLAGLVAVASW